VTTEKLSIERLRPCVNPACTSYTVTESGICPKCRRFGYVLPVAIEPEVPAFAVTRSSNPADTHVPESDIQKGGDALLERQGWFVARTGQRKSKGVQDAGVPDSIAMKPGYGVLFVEYKRPVGGVQSEEQHIFEEHCIAAGVRYWLISQVEQLHTRLAALQA
jgi:hypothetical protein